MPKRFDKCLQFGPGNRGSSRRGVEPIAPETRAAPGPNHGGGRRGEFPTNGGHFEPFLNKGLKYGLKTFEGVQCSQKL